MRQPPKPPRRDGGEGEWCLLVTGQARAHAAVFGPASDLRGDLPEC